VFVPEAGAVTVSLDSLRRPLGRVDAFTSDPGSPAGRWEAITGSRWFARRRHPARGWRRGDRGAVGRTWRVNRRRCRTSMSGRWSTGCSRTENLSGTSAERPCAKASRWRPGGLVLEEDGPRCWDGHRRAGVAFRGRPV